MEQNQNQRLPSVNRHLDDDAIQKHLMQLHDTPWDPSELEFLEHISRCSYCAEKFSHQIEADGLLKAPPDLKTNILNETKNLKIQTELALHKTSAKMQLLFYSLRVGGALLGALAILFLSSTALSYHWNNSGKTSSGANIIQEEESFSLSHALNRGSNQINQLLQDFSNQFLSMEDNNYDKQKK